MAKKQALFKTATKATVRRRIKLAVVPHKANDHRPHLVRRTAILVALVLVVVSQGAYNAMTTGNVLGNQADLTPKILLEATNKARTDNGRSELALNVRLNDAARYKVNDMFNRQYWDHIAPDGTPPWRWFEQAGYRYAEAGENLAKNFSTSKGVISAWMISPSHRENVLKQSYRDVGFATRTGELNGKTVTITVAMYGTSDEVAVQGAVDTNVTNIGVTFNPMTRLGLALQALSPVTVASIVLLLGMANVALLAHINRHKLPAGLRKGWYRHHGLYKATFLILVASILVMSYTMVTGQI